MKLSYRHLCLTILITCVSACTTVQLPPVNHYQLTTFGKVTRPQTKPKHTLLVTPTSAVLGYDTQNMLYIEQPFKLSTFANNNWTTAPANMLFPLIIQSLEDSHYFYAVAASPDTSTTEYRLDTQLITLQQNFLVKPSRVELVVQMTLTHVSDNHVVIARTLHKSIACTSDSPYGGVLAANEATRWMTQQITQRVVTHLKGA